MTSTLATVVGNVFTRVLALEKLAVPDALYASRRWVDYHADVPYWTNRLAVLPQPHGPYDLPMYDLQLQMRLILIYQSGVTREDNVDGNAQEKALVYAPTVVEYFEAHRDLAPRVLDEDDELLYTPLTHVVAPGVQISSARGMDLDVLPLTRSIYLFLDFELLVPIVIGRED